MTADHKSVFGALIGAVRAAAEHNGHIQEITGNDSPRVKAALDLIERACAGGCPSVEEAKKLVAQLRDAALHDATLEGMKDLLK